ncbi:DNA cytosine methyltransferase [Bacillus atrophaeus]|uniref:DNA cytosine methyltransferase n=1 Tax=Bacillus atrophaeus TaxID=1452 RepID=UPI002E1E7B83|nr:DNA cytosine methyltransferase [Bacillus atrophaeus]
MYKVLDLFAGAGGMSLGFSQTKKFHIAVAVEKHQYAQLTYRQNHESTIVLDEILEITDYDAFKNEYGNFDIIVGGPPCQGFSNANRQKNHIISQNNSLVKKYVEVIENIKPMAFVMENVRMLRSDIHRFYRSEDDNLEGCELTLKPETLCLYEGTCPVEDINKYMFNRKIVEELLLSENSRTILRTILKGSYKEEKRDDILRKKSKNGIKIINAIPNRGIEVPMHYRQFEQDALAEILAYLEGKISFAEAEPYMVSYMSMQRLLSAAKELLDNKIVIQELRVDGTGIYVDVESFTVVDYIKEKLGKLYLIHDDVLNAAWFGAPQSRERYIALGIRKDIAEKNGVRPRLPKQKYFSHQYRTVKDAISDLQEIEPSYDVNEDKGIDISLKSYKETALTADLRNSAVLYNHITTETRETALKRFAALKPGQNFHDLDKGLIEDTYSKPERTQNSIYLRLDYENPSGTVTNVRKSMWIHPVVDRAISIREAARLQTFPDNFIFIGTKDSQYQQVGNAVPPLMAKAIAEELVKLLGACGIEKVTAEKIAELN